MSSGFDMRERYCYRVKLPTLAEARRIRGLPDFTPEQLTERREFLASMRMPDDGTDPMLNPSEHRAPAIMCGRFGPPCFHCGGVSESLCDFPLGEENRTCDRALCEECAPSVDADKNYCHEHDEHGRNMLLFPQPKRAVAEPGPEPRSRAKPLPKMPPWPNRWRVRQARGDSGSHGAVLTSWKPQIDAMQFAAKVGGCIETWDEFVLLWRTLYPLASKKPRKP